MITLGVAQEVGEVTRRGNSLREGSFANIISQSGQFRKGGGEDRGRHNTAIQGTSHMQPHSLLTNFMLWHFVRSFTKVFTVVKSGFT